MDSHLLDPAPGEVHGRFIRTAREQFAASDHAWLRAVRDGTASESRALKDIEDSHLRYANGVVTSTANLVAEIGLALNSPGSTNAQLGVCEAIAHYNGVGDWDPRSDADFQALLPAIGTWEGVGGALRAARPTWIVGPAIDLVFMFTGRLRTITRSTKVNVLFSGGEVANGTMRRGTVGTVTLERLEDGLSEIYPAMPEMAFYTMDQAWLDTVHFAFTSIGSQQGSVRWWINWYGDENWLTREVAGASCGLGFAVGLMDLVAPEPVGIDSDWAFTGAIEDNAGVLHVRHVDGYADKLAAASRLGLNVILPRECLEKACRRGADCNPGSQANTLGTLGG